MSVRVTSFPRPRVDYVAAEGLWDVLEDWPVQFSTFSLTIPGGYRSDLASIHRAVWPLVAPFELSIAAPLAHDFLYRYLGAPPPRLFTLDRPLTRAEVDHDVFLSIMSMEGVKAWRRTAAYNVVSLSGGLIWRRYEAAALLRAPLSWRLA